MDFINLKYYKYRGYPLIKTHYARLHNFGDLFNKDLLNFLGYKLIYTESWEYSDVALSGSILQHYHQNFIGKILGAGYNDQKYFKETVKCEVKILRGPLSALQCNKDNEKIIYGDPGILASLIFKSKKNDKYKLGIVPHYVDYDFAIKYLSEFKNIRVINVRQSPKKVSEAILSCENIASSSLHGLIFADSFRIPNIHLKFGNLLFGGLHKFEDYYLGMDSASEVLEYEKGMDINIILSKCQLRYSKQYLANRQQELKKVLEYELNLIKQ
jgi:pyruvyltransferase